MKPFNVDAHQVIFILAAIVIALWVIRAFRRWTSEDKDPFDVRDLFMENGRASKGAVVLMGAFIATTTHFVYYTFTGKMNEAYFTLYVGAWITPVVTRLIVSGGKPPAPEGEVKP